MHYYLYLLTYKNYTRMSEKSLKLTFPSLFNESLRKHAGCNAYSFAGETPKTYETVAREIRALSSMLEKAGLNMAARLPYSVQICPTGA